MMDVDDAHLNDEIYRLIAPRVGLHPGLRGNDITASTIYRARIPTPLFKAMVEDLGIVIDQYGGFCEHNNEEARSRFLAPFFNRAIALFKSTIVNTPEYGTSTGGIKNYFRVLFGGYSILVILVNEMPGRGRLNTIIQVISQCDACNYANNRAGFPSSPIYAVVSDGRIFEFFSFNGKTAVPTLSRGVFPVPNTTQSIQRLATWLYNSDSPANTEFILRLRPICETIFYFLLLAYRSGIEVQIECLNEPECSETREACMPKWKEAHVLACNALTLAVEAGVKAANHDEAADEQTEEALKYLQESLAAIPAAYKRNIGLMGSWDEERVRFC